MCIGFCLSPMRRRRMSTLFPYTTLFRSHGEHDHRDRHLPVERLVLGLGADFDFHGSSLALPPEIEVSAERSEEHTSELQSRENLVCRLLLEKTKPDDSSYFQAPRGSRIH